jgi:hypothetical protein
VFRVAHVAVSPGPHAGGRRTLPGMTNGVRLERQRLAERLAESDRERDRILYALDVLARLDESDPPTRAKTPSRRTTPPRIPAGSSSGARKRGRTGARPGSAYERAVAVVTASDRQWPLDDLIVEMRRSGWTAQVLNERETVRTALARAVTAGKIRRLSDGMFAAGSFVQDTAIPPIADVDSVAALNSEDRPDGDAGVKEDQEWGGLIQRESDEGL